MRCVVSGMGSLCHRERNQNKERREQDLVDWQFEPWDSPNNRSHCRKANDKKLSSGSKMY